MNELGQMKPLIEKIHWNKSYDITQNIQIIEIAILGLAACFSKGNCLQIIIPTDIHKKYSDWFETLKKECDSSVCIWKVKEEERGAEEISPYNTCTITTTILVQEAKSSTKYNVCLYDLLDKSVDGNDEEELKVSLWTREPCQTRLSLDDLVSHRKNKGVDNTGKSKTTYFCFVLFVLITALPLTDLRLRFSFSLSCSYF